MNLNSVLKGQEVIIDSILLERIALQLAQMGIFSKSKVKILHKNSKTIIIESNNTRVLLGSGIAATIEVCQQ